MMVVLTDILKLKVTFLSLNNYFCMYLYFVCYYFVQFMNHSQLILRMNHQCDECVYVIMRL